MSVEVRLTPDLRESAVQSEGSVETQQTRQNGGDHAFLTFRLAQIALILCPRGRTALLFGQGRGMWAVCGRGHAVLGGQLVAASSSSLLLLNQRGCLQAASRAQSGNFCLET